jgi:hypothetical protein
MPISHSAVPFIVDFQGGPSNDGAAIILKIGLSDGRKFTDALPLGTIGAVVPRIELLDDPVDGALQRLAQSAEVATEFKLEPRTHDRRCRILVAREER